MARLKRASASFPHDADPSQIALSIPDVEMSEETVSQASRTQTRAGEFFRRLELPGHALLCIYFAVFARQYLWWVTDNNWIAWIGSALVAVFVTWLYISSEERTAKDKVELASGFSLPAGRILSYAFAF